MGWEGQLQILPSFLNSDVGGGGGGWHRLRYAYSMWVGKNIGKTAESPTNIFKT